MSSSRHPISFITLDMITLGIITLGITTIMLFFSICAHASTTSLIINGKTIHHSNINNIKLNENNWGGGLHRDYNIINKKWVPFITASGFKDSINNPSYYAGGGLMRRHNIKLHKQRLHIDVGLIGIIMTRENIFDGKPFPGVLPAVSLGTDRFSVNMTYIPKVHPDIIPAVFFQFKIPLSLTEQH